MPASFGREYYPRRQQRKYQQLLGNIHWKQNSLTCQAGPSNPEPAPSTVTALPAPSTKTAPPVRSTAPSVSPPSASYPNEASALWGQSSPINLDELNYTWACNRLHSPRLFNSSVHQPSSSSPSSFLPPDRP